MFNVTMLAVFRYHIPLLFTQDREVIELVARTLPVCAVMQLFDGMAAVSHGLLRGIGRQEFGGYANLVCYYLVALPISFGLAFGLGWELTGLWVGVTFGLLLYVSPDWPRSSIYVNQSAGSRWSSIGSLGELTGTRLPRKPSTEMLLDKRQQRLPHDLLGALYNTYSAAHDNVGNKQKFGAGKNTGQK